MGKSGLKGSIESNKMSKKRRTVTNNRIWKTSDLVERERKKKHSNTKLKLVRGRSRAQWLAFLLTNPTAPGLIPSIPKKNSEDKIVNVAGVNQWACWEKSGLWLENVDWTHVVLDSGRLELQKVGSPRVSYVIDKQLRIWVGSWWVQSSVSACMEFLLWNDEIYPSLCDLLMPVHENNLTRHLLNVREM